MTSTFSQRRVLRASAATAAVCVALAAGGCGSSSKTPAASSSGSSATTAPGTSPASSAVSNDGAALAVPLSKEKASCRTGKGVIGYVPKLGTDPYMVTVKKAAEAAAKAVGGKIIYTSPSSATGAAQIPFIDQLISDGVCAISMSGSDANSSAAALAKARAAGINVITWDSDTEASSRTLFVNQASSPLLGADMLVSMRNLLGAKGGEFAILSSTPTATNQNAWIAAMKQQLATNPADKNLKLVKVAYGQEEADTNAQQATALAEAYPNLKGIIVPAGIGFPAAANALSQTGALGRIKLTGLAPVSLISKYLLDGSAQDIWWNVTNLGTLSYDAAQALEEGKLTGKAGQTFSAGSLGTFTVGAQGQILLGKPTIVTAANANAFPF